MPYYTEDKQAAEQMKADEMQKQWLEQLKASQQKQQEESKWL
jgi:hypothetical protein